MTPTRSDSPVPSGSEPDPDERSEEQTGPLPGQSLDDPTLDLAQTPAAASPGSASGSGSGTASGSGRGSGWFGAGFEPGQLLAGRYRVLRFVARGAMGEVYEVED